MPSTQLLFGILFLMSFATGIVSVALINYTTIGTASNQIVAAGLLTGILVVMLPTLLTVMVMKLMRRNVKTKYLLFISMMGAAAYCVFIILSAAMYHITINYSLANAIILVGDASIFALWFFISKVVLGQKKKAIVTAVVQPLFNILIYLAANNFIFTFAIPLNILLIKLGAGIVIFLIISYMLLYIFDSPLKRNFGFGGIDAFSQFVQNWLFDVDMTVGRPLGKMTIPAPSLISKMFRGIANVKMKLLAAK